MGYARTAGYSPFRIITRALPVSVPSPSVAASQAYHVASKPPHGSHDSFPFQRRTHRNGQLHAWTQEHKDDADLREDNQRKTQSGYGKPCRKVKQRRGICRLHHLKKRSHET